MRDGASSWIWWAAAGPARADEIRMPKVKSIDTIDHQGWWFSPA
jgi:hypothetical protein